MSDAPPNCAECGAPVPQDAPGGVCPRCLMREGVTSVRESRGRMGGRPAPPEPDELAPLFPDLEILEFVGRGGMGTVYKARQRRLDRLVALKLLDTEAARGPTFSDRFAREARTLARVSHPNIVSIHDYGEVEGLHFLTMEFVDGANLREVLEAGSMSPEEALAIVPQVCDALQFAHEEGVVHRDIKPENILVDRKGRVKIADFGLAKMLDIDDPDRTLTMSGQMMGTPAYMAPEQIETPGRVDHRADIYSLGVVFYEMLTGELPLGRFAAPSDKVQIDVRLDEVVLRSLAKEPDRRYQRAVEVKTAVESLDESPPPEQGRKKVRRTKAEVKGAVKESVKGAAVAFAESAAVFAGEAVSLVEDTLSGNSVPPGAAAEEAGPTRVVEIRRPFGVTLVAIYCIVCFAILFPSGSLISGRGGSLFDMSRGWSGTYNPLVFLGGPLFGSWTLAFFGVVVGIGLFRLRRWARIGATILAFIGCFQAFPIGLVLSVPVLIYLLRKDVQRIFDLGEGAATLDETEAATLEKLVGKPRR